MNTSTPESEQIEYRQRCQRAMLELMKIEELTSKENPMSNEQIYAMLCGNMLGCGGN